MFNLGSELRKTRKKCNLTLDQLAISSGVDRGTISRIELGHVSPRIDTISFLCQAMNTTLSQFFGLPEAGPGAQAGNGHLVAGNGGGEPGFADPDLDPGGAPVEFKFPMGGPAEPALEGYWPVPSTFWRGLLEVLERFEVLVKNSREMIVVKDRAGKILYTSPPCEEILGFRPQDLVGQTSLALLHPEDAAGYQDGFDSLLLQPGAIRVMDYRVRCKDGSWCQVSAKYTNQLDNPNIRAVVVNAMKVQ